MIIFFENFYKRKENHFDQRYKERIELLNLDSKTQKKLDANLKYLWRYKDNFSKKTLAHRLLRFTDKYIKFEDAKGKFFYGNELWVIVRNSEMATILIRKSGEVRPKNRGLNKFKTDLISYNNTDLLTISRSL